jgi:large subunit ribosomal protein L4e
MQHSAESWGTGRAVARIPRVSGGGTHRAGQAAFGNMCRKGRLASPTKTWRRWHRKINVNQKRYAVASALAASSLTSLVLARGHRVDNIAEVPLVVNDTFESVKTTKQALSALKALGCEEEITKVADSRKIRAGRGKMRNRRYVQRRGPLVVYNENNGVCQAVRNIPGVEYCQVSRLNLLQLAPGGHLGRFIIWTRSAFEQLESLYGTTRTASKKKVGYHLPRSMMQNSDVSRVINSDEVQTVVRPVIRQHRAHLKHNALKNLVTIKRLNPAFNYFQGSKKRKCECTEGSSKKAKVEEKVSE